MFDYQLLQPAEPGIHLAALITPSDMRRFGTWAGKTLQGAPWQSLRTRIGVERTFNIHHTCLLTMTEDRVLVPMAHCQSPGLPDEVVMGVQPLCLNWRPVVLDGSSLEDGELELSRFEPLRVFGSGATPDAEEEWAPPLALWLHECQVRLERVGPAQFLGWIVDHLSEQIFGAAERGIPLNPACAA